MKKHKPLDGQITIDEYIKRLTPKPFNKKLPAGYKQSRSLDNFFRANFAADNEWGIPEIQKTDVDLTGAKWVSFGEKAAIKDPANTVLHFYIDDYKFNIVWDAPHRYINLFRQCRAVVTPDFSNYNDMPKAQHLWNHYRRQWVGRYWQDRGVNVICSLSWGVGCLYDWSFEGIPQHTVCAASFVSENMNKEAAVYEMMEALDVVKPSALFIKCGAKDEEALREYFDFEVIPTYRFKGGG
jgi:hypothetical protein